MLILLVFKDFHGVNGQEIWTWKFSNDKIPIVLEISPLNSHQHFLFQRSDLHIMLYEFIMLTKSEPNFTSWCHPKLKISYVEISGSLSGVILANFHRIWIVTNTQFVLSSENFKKFSSVAKVFLTIDMIHPR